MSKGSADTRTPNHEARRESAIWCETCSMMKGGACKCTEHASLAALATHPIGRALLEACGHDTATHQARSECTECGRQLRMDDTVAWGGERAAMCVQCYFKRSK